MTFPRCVLELLYTFIYILDRNPTHVEGQDEPGLPILHTLFGSNTPNSVQITGVPTERASTME